MLIPCLYSCIISDYCPPDVLCIHNILIAVLSDLLPKYFVVVIGKFLEISDQIQNPFTRMGYSNSTLSISFNIPFLSDDPGIDLMSAW